MTTNQIRYDEEHILLREEARRWLSERCTPAEVRRLSGNERGDDPKLWRELAEMGWTGLLAGEAHGGAGLGAMHLAVLMEECGRRLLPSPLLPTLLASLVLNEAASDEQQSRWLPGIASGDCIATLAHVRRDGGFEVADTPVAVEAGGKIHGELHHVWGATSADLVLAPARTASGLRFVAVGRGCFEVEQETGLDPSRRQGRVRFAGTLASDAILPVDAEQAWLRLLPSFLTALSAEMAGGADALLGMTAEYVATREQFGKSIGAFQAIKHPLVDVLVGVEQLRSLVYAAATAIGEDEDDALFLARAAKAQASDVYSFAASRAIQFHGGYGFTEDCDAHLYLRRAQCMRPAFGDARHQRAFIADAVLQAPELA